MSNAAEQTEVLAPEASLRIGDELIEVRPFGFLEGVSLGPAVAPIVHALADMAESTPAVVGAADEHGEAEGEAGPDDQSPDDLDRLNEIFAAHLDTLLQLMARATGKPVEWIKALPDDDGQALLMLFWTVNRDFFTRRLLSRALMRRHMQARPRSSAH